MDIGALLVKLGIDTTGLKAGLAESDASLGAFGSSLDGASVHATTLSASQLKVQESAALADLSQQKYSSTLARFGEGSAQAELASARMGKAQLVAADASKAAGSALGGLTAATGGLINPMTIATAAITAGAFAMADSIKAASDDEASIAQLTASLRANVPGWDGTTAAIEDYIASAEKASAFSKDDLRTSLEALVGATHDITKAEQDQAIATNLARFKNEDLATATQQVVDIEAGRFRGLAQLGIAVHKGETAQEALNAVNEVAAGQDTSYLGTEAGQMDALNNSVHDLEVELGQKLLPVFKDVLTFINNNVIPAVGTLATVWDGALNQATFGATHALAAWNTYQQAQSDAAAAAQVAFEKMAAASKTTADEITGDFTTMTGDTSAYGDAAKAAAETQAQALTGIDSAYYRSKLSAQRANNDALMTANDQADAQSLALEVAQRNKEQAATDAAAKATAAAAQKAGFDAAAAYGQGLHQGQDTVDSDLKQLTDDIKNTLSVPKQVAKLEGELTSKALAKALSDNRPQVKTDAIATVQAIMDQLTLLGITTPKLSKPAAEALQKAMAAAKSPTLTAAEQVQQAVQTGLTADYYSFGYATGMTWVDGMTDAISKAPPKVKEEQQKIYKILHAESPPGPESPLHDIDKWGFRTGTAYVDNLTKGLAGSGPILAGLPGGIPGNSAGLHAAAGMGTRSGSVQPIIIPVYLEGQKITEVTDRGSYRQGTIYGQPVLHGSSAR
jgi:hypothetical protein